MFLLYEISSLISIFLIRRLWFDGWDWSKMIASLVSRTALTIWGQPTVAKTKCSKWMSVIRSMCWSWAPAGRSIKSDTCQPDICTHVSVGPTYGYWCVDFPGTCSSAFCGCRLLFPSHCQLTQHNMRPRQGTSFGEVESRSPNLSMLIINDRH